MSSKIKNINDVIPENLKGILSKKKIRQAELARLLKRPRQTIADWISGRRIIYPIDVKQIANVLGVSPNALFGIEDPKEFRIVREEASEVIASITQDDIIYRDGYRVELINDNDELT